MRKQYVSSLATFAPRAHFCSLRRYINYVNNLDGKRNMVFTPQMDLLLLLAAAKAASLAAAAAEVLPFERSAFKWI